VKFDFKNGAGETLSGRLELPASAPKAFALFAHCFTCSKDVIAAATISKSLTQSGLGVLRFDFTGLGNSDGDFSNTNFSSNVEDLITAAKALSEAHSAPQVLIGHSLGGAAILKAAARIESVKAVVTIGSPSSVDHVTHLFEENLEEIEADGKANVKLAGREFTIRKQFVEDLKESAVLDTVATLKAALLVMHSPVDNYVSIDHAGKIFSTAKHPKSFISLDNADHLLMNRKDAQYVAQAIGAWADRYISAAKTETSVSVSHGDVVVLNRPEMKFTQDIYSENHHIIADEPKSLKGNDLGMTPYELLLAGLGACTSMTMKMYADRKGIALKNARVHLHHTKVHAEDCEACETTDGKVDKIEKSIFLSGDLSPEDRTKLLEIAEKCPVNRTLKSEIWVTSKEVTEPGAD